MADRYTMGVDIGSTTSKCVILKNGTDVLARSLVPVGTGTSGPKRAVAAALQEAGLSDEKITCTAATGYGRNTFPADYQISELSCHARGAYCASIRGGAPGVRTVIDIGGQDAKVMRIGADGRLENFIMNDKCAAGTGRFLDVMARVLELELSDLERLDAEAETVCKISSTCTVFAESEVISQLANNVDLPSLVAGIHESVAVRTVSLAKRLGVTEPLMMTGGVARNGGVVRALERELMTGIAVPEDCQLMGAYGAAMLAWEKGNKKESVNGR